MGVRLYKYTEVTEDISRLLDSRARKHYQGWNQKSELERQGIEQVLQNILPGETLEKACRDTGYISVHAIRAVSSAGNLPNTLGSKLFVEGLFGERNFIDLDPSEAEGVSGLTLVI